MAGKSTQRARKTLDRQQAQTRAANELSVREARVDPEVLEYVQSISNSPRRFITDLLWVNSIEGGQPRRFALNSAQNAVIEAVERQQAAGRPIRLIVLKARRTGISTLCEALVYWACSTRHQTTGMVVAHKKEIAREIFRISKGFYQRDNRHRLGLAPEIEASNEQALRFANPDKRLKHVEPGLESAMLVATAEGRDVGRGLTLQALHMSEVGFYESPEVMAGLEIALSKTPGSIGIMESTANGTGNLFHEQWREAVAGRSGWEPIFIPWMMREECAIELTRGEREQWDWLDREERDYAEKYDLSLEQVKWRRREVASPALFRPGISRVDMFRQEYPATAEEAFLSSGKNFFMMAPLGELQRSNKGERKPSWCGLITNSTSLKDRPESSREPLKPFLSEDKYGPLQIWEPPIAGEDYVVGADVAEGLEHGDDSVAIVLRRRTLSVVARWRGRRLDPDQFGQVCALLAQHYNFALLGIEQNGPGISANLAAQKLRYIRLWYDRAVENLSQGERDRVGWRTTSASRVSMLAALEAELREGKLNQPSAEFYKEAETFINATTDGGRSARAQAESGRHDDEIMATAIALQMHILGGALRGKRRDEPPDIDYAQPRARPMNGGKKHRIRLSYWS